MDFSNIAELVERHGLKTTLISITIYLVVMGIKNGYISNVLKKVFKHFKGGSNGNNPNAISYTDVYNHEIFNTIDFWVHSQVPTFEFDTDFKTNVFRTYFKIYLTSYKNILTKIFKNSDFKKLDSAELRQMFLKTITDIVYDYESRMKDSNIPGLVISKLKVVNNDSLNLMIDMINSTCDNEFYESDNNLLKAYLFLNILLSVLENAIQKNKTYFNSLNGDFKGLEFNGYVE